MSDDETNQPRLVVFPTKPLEGFTPIAPPDGKGRYGIFPLGSGDVLVTLEVFNTILAMLERGDSTGRAQIASMLRRNYAALFVGRPEEP